MRAALLLLVCLLQGVARPAQALCNLMNGTTATCRELDDARYIDTYDLDGLVAPVIDNTLRPGLFGNFTSLKHLNLSGGELENVEPGSLAELGKLRSLNLADNYIEHLQLTSFEGLQKLQNLDLRRNVIRQLPPAVLTLKRLRVLEISGNPLECNCATLRVRDLLLSRGVRLSKRISCAGPAILRGTSLLKANTHLTCMFEEQDGEMQGDQAFAEEEGSGELGSGDATFDELESDFDDENGGFDEEVETSSSVPAVAAETPAPETPPALENVATKSDLSSGNSEGKNSSSSASTEATQLSSSNGIQEGNLNNDELFFDGGEASSSPATNDDDEDGFADDLIIPVEEKDSSSEDSGIVNKSAFTDELIIPVEGSGVDAAKEDEDGSGSEGSGSGILSVHPRLENNQEFASTVEPSTASTSSSSLFDMLFGSFWTTAAPPVEEKDELKPEEEDFIEVTSESSVPSSENEEEPIEEDVIIPGSVVPVEARPEDRTTESSNFGRGLAVPDSITEKNSDMSGLASTTDSSISGKIIADADSADQANANVSTSRQSKKGMGSYVVLGALLAVLAALIGFAAYKGDFCRKKRKRDDVERGTELKDMQKSLLDNGSSNQPKIASNGNAENAPLVDSPSQGWSEPREIRPWQENQPSAAMPVDKSALQDPTEPVKPPRKSVPPQDDAPRATNGTVSEPVHSFEPIDPPLVVDTSQLSVTPPNSPVTPLDRPPLSPGAQRVKITLQENPDSVPRTPILITRTKGGENLVKTP